MKIDITNCVDEISLDLLQTVRCESCGTRLGWTNHCDEQPTFYCDHCVIEKRILVIQDRLTAHSESIQQLER